MNPFKSRSCRSIKLAALLQTYVLGSQSGAVAISMKEVERVVTRSNARYFDLSLSPNDTWLKKDQRFSKNALPKIGLCRLAARR